MERYFATPGKFLKIFMNDLNMYTTFYMDDTARKA